MIMKRNSLVLIIIACLSVLWPADAEDSRVITNFDKQWRFIQADVHGAESPSYNDRRWRILNLPHDWSIEGINSESEPSAGEGGYFPTGIGWYRKTFDISDWSPERKYFIEFDGVYMNSEVWVNGHSLGRHPYGYSSFSYDMTPWLKARNNVISVRVDNSEHPNTRWYTGSGIYRHVRLVSVNPLHFKKWGVFAWTESLADGVAKLRVEADIVNDFVSNDVIVRNVLVDADGNTVTEVENPLNFENSETLFSSCNLYVKDARLWSLNDPYLYTLRTSLVLDDREIDLVETPVGLRTIEYDANKGFFLNGEHVKLFGVNVHHDGGPVGAAVPERVWERRLEILKSGGCNAVRTAHNHPAPEFLDLCDRLGILVMDEAFDMWMEGKNDKDYHIYFADWYERDLEALVLRDRNHPSVIMWSIGNEIPDQSTAEGPMLARRMINICHKHDPTRPVTSGNDRIKDEARLATEEFLAEFNNEILGYNYPDRFRTRRETMYTEDKIAHPTRRVVATEAGGLSGTRAYGQDARWFFYHGMDSGEDLTPAERMAMRVPASASYIDTEQRWKYTLLNDFVIGDFMWTGIDYYGETRWPSRGASCGYLDNCGFKKDGYWFFKSIWTDDPVLHLAGGWNYPAEQAGKIVQVNVFTNFDYVELFVNGKSYGVKSREFPRKGQTVTWNVSPEDKVRTSSADLHMSWDVEYQPGEVKLVGFKDGEQYTEIVRTPGEPAVLRVHVDREIITCRPGDVAHVIVEVLDKEGNLVTGENGNLPISFSVSGPAELIGVESGNMYDLSSTKIPLRKAYGGMLLGIFRAEKAGKFSVTASTEGLPPAEIIVSVE